MDDTLTLFLNQRAVILDSDDATVALLRRHDRRLLGFMQQGGLSVPLLRRKGDDDALIASLVADAGRWLVVLEARERCWPGELARLQRALLSTPDTQALAWWLAAHYPALECPTDFPGEFAQQRYAALALYRRGHGPLLPAPWDQWAEARGGAVSLLPVSEALWSLSGGEDWSLWLGPLLAGASSDAVSALVNRLAGQASDSTLIELMGLSCQGHFLPWLASIRHDPELKQSALREMRWLTGGESHYHRSPQCWGQSLSASPWPELFHRLPLGFRQRLWHWCHDSVLGSATSLQGGRWCTGN